MARVAVTKKNMKTITAEFSDNLPDTEGENERPGFATEDQRPGAKRRLFAMCVCKAENEGLGDKFKVVRTVTEEKQNVQGIKFLKFTLKAEFTEAE